ncbi:MAG: porin family protein [Ferruginibacter sp.]
MKHKILLLAALFFSTASFAQRVSFGAAAGVTNYRISGQAADNLKQFISFADGYVNTKPLNGFYAGGFASVPVNEMISVEPGLYYSAKGYQLGGEYAVKGIEILNASANAQLHTNYIDLPVLVKATFNGLQVFAGPQFSYLTNASLDTRAAVAGFTVFNNKMDVSNQFNKVDIGITGGVGYQLANGMRITAAYDRGLSKVDAGKNLNSYNQGFKIGLGMHF